MNNDQNQNLDTLNQTPPVVGPDTIAPPTGEPASVPVTPTEPVAPVNPAEPAAPVNPEPIPAAPVTPVNPEPIPAAPVPSEPATVNPIPPVDAINLQPEGVVPQVPENNNANTVEPLMSTPLTPDTNLTGMNQAAPAQPDMNAQPQMGGMGMNPMPAGMDMMGVPTPPPIQTDNGGKKEKKKGSNKILLIILVVVLIAGIGYGVYYFLVASKSKTDIVITPNKIEAELGVDIDITRASNFATVTGYDINSCTVETNLNTSVYGTYQYTVTCGTRTSNSTTISVRDTQPPETVLKDVVVLPNASIKPEDFFESITDASEYTLEFDEEVDTSVPGEYEVSITLSDEYENKVTVNGILIVDNNAPATYLVCTKEDNDAEPNATFEYKFGFSANGNHYNTNRTVTLVFTNIDDYDTAVEEYNQSNTVNGMSGEFEFNEENLQITISGSIANEDLLDDLDTDTTPITEDDIQNLFTNECELSLN